MKIAIDKTDITKEELLKLRIFNNGLVKQFDKIDTCVTALLGIQCQYQNYANIAIYNRVKETSLEKIYSNKSLIKGWGQRTTLHIYNKKDYGIISNIYKDLDNWVYKNLRKVNIDYKIYLKNIEDYLKQNDEITKKEIKNIIPKKYNN